MEDAKHDVYVADLSGLSDATEELIRVASLGWDLYGITATTPQFPMAMSHLRTIRQIDPGKRVVIGGPHPTVMPESCGSFDCVVLGDGEEAILEALEPAAPKRIDRATNTKKGLLEWKWPSRHLIDMDSYRYSVGGAKGTSMMISQGCPYQSPREDTLVGLPDGLVRPIELAYVRQDVCVVGHEHRIARFGGAEFASHPDKEDCVVITAQNGLELVVTRGHKIKVLVGRNIVWKLAQDLGPSDYLCVAVGQNRVSNLVRLDSPNMFQHNKAKKEVTIPTVLDEDLAWLIGYFLGDGNFMDGSTQGIGFCVDDTTRSLLTEKIQRVFGVGVSLYRPRHVSERSSMQYASVASIVLFEFFKQSLGIVHGDKLHVPLVVRKSPQCVVQAFLEGLGAADQYISDGARHRYLVTADLEFAREVLSLMLWSGFGGTIHGPYVPGYGKRVWRVYWCRVGDQMNPCIYRRSGRVCWVGTIPTIALYKHATDGKWRYRKTVRHGTRRALLSEIMPEDSVLNSGYWFSRVQSVESAGKHQVYSISNPPTHEYAAFGIVLSNCSFCSGRLVPYYRRVRVRDTDDVVREMEHLITRYGIQAVMAFDDEINLLNEPLLEFCRKVAPLKMKFRAFVKANLYTDEQAAAMAEAGFTDVCTGVEAGDDRILGVIDKQTTRKINKGFVDLTRKYGMRGKAFCSIGHPGETHESVMNLKEWLLWARPDDFDVTVITVYPGTPIWAGRERVGLTGGGTPICRYVKTSRNPQENGATLFFEEIDYSKEFSFYKGRPTEYISHVWTPDLSKEDLVLLRDQVEDEVRKELHIPYPKRYSGDYLEGQTNFDHGMGMGATPQDTRVQLKAGSGNGAGVVSDAP